MVPDITPNISGMVLTSNEIISWMIGFTVGMIFMAVLFLAVYLEVKSG